jgi:single-stranded-DNA-specific exonuclease
VRNAQEWILRRQVPAALVRQCTADGLNLVLAKVLCARHLDTPAQIHAFLSGEGSELGDPLDMPDMGRAIERIRRAILSAEAIAVYGDFDVDGITSTALLVSVLRGLGGNASPYIPDRFDEGYGLNVDALDRIRAQGASLCIAVDCGVRSSQEVAHARSHGLDMIIVDHHTAPAELPPAVAVVDPKRSDSAYPFSELAGVGVTYQLCRALSDAMQDTDEGRQMAHRVDDYLDLVALGTVADIVPLEGENRALARWGLNRLRSSPRPGLLALMEQAGVEPSRVGSIDVAFRLAPRLNAAGRLEHAKTAYELLMAEDLGQARTLAETLGRTNHERQSLLEEQVALAMTDLAREPLEPLLIVQGPDYHEGIVGLIASRLREAFYRPTLVLRADAETARGSARSVDGFHITHALDSCSDLLMRYGGHAQAAGFTLASDRLPEFRRRLQDYAAEHLAESALTPRLLVDAIVPLGALTPDVVSALATMEPFGKGNPEPLLASLGARIRSMNAVGQDGKHLRLNIHQANTSLPCIAFRQGALLDQYRPGDRIDLVYRPSMNHWQGRSTLQLVVEAVRPARDDS